MGRIAGNSVVLAVVPLLESRPELAGLPGIRIGAGAIDPGNIRIGAGANVAAGSIVQQDVPDGSAVVVTKARNIDAAKVSFV